MLCRVRTTLADRPGALAGLAASCGRSGLNILALQIFPGIEAVTDELVVSVPDDWTLSDVEEMVRAAGGQDVSVSVCSVHALVDGPTNYLLAVRHVLEEPGSLHEALGELLDCDVDADAGERGLAALEVAVGDHLVTVRRTAEFTITEEARANAFAAVVAELLAGRNVASMDLPAADVAPVYRPATAQDALALVRMAGRCSAASLVGRFGAPLSGLQPRMARRLLASGPALVAEVGREVVGLAMVTPGPVPEVSLLVEDGWQGRGIGTRLLSLAAQLAKAHGAAELVLQTEHNLAAVPRLSAAAGLSGRMRQHGGRVVLTASLRRVAPLPHDVERVSLRPLDPASA